MPPLTTPSVQVPPQRIDARVRLSAPETKMTRLLVHTHFQVPGQIAVGPADSPTAIVRAGPLPVAHDQRHKVRSRTDERQSAAGAGNGVPGGVNVDDAVVEFSLGVGCG